MNRWIRILLFLLIFTPLANAAPPPPDDDNCNENPFVVDTPADVKRIVNGYHCEKTDVVIKTNILIKTPDGAKNLVVEAGSIVLEDVNISNELPSSEIMFLARAGDIRLTSTSISTDKDITLRCEPMMCNILGARQNNFYSTYIHMRAGWTIWFEGTNVTAAVDAEFRSWHSIQFYKSSWNTMPMVFAKNIVLYTEGDIGIDDWVFLNAKNRVHLGALWSVWAKNCTIRGKVVEIIGGMHVDVTNTDAAATGRLAVYVKGSCKSGMNCVEAGRAALFGKVLEMGTPQGKGTISLCRGRFRDSHPLLPSINGKRNLPYDATVFYTDGQCGAGKGARIDR